MTTDEEKAVREANLKKWKRRVVIVGVLLALICKSLPVDYQGPCSAIAQLCTGGLLSP